MLMFFMMMWKGGIPTLVAVFRWASKIILFIEVDKIVFPKKNEKTYRQYMTHAARHCKLSVYLLNWCLVKLD